jgi:hypothetical protein
VGYICFSHRGGFLLHNRRDQSYFIHDRKYIKDKTETGVEKVRGHDLCRIIPSHNCTKRSEISVVGFSLVGGGDKEVVLKDHFKKVTFYYGGVRSRIVG